MTSRGQAPGRGRCDDRHRVRHSTGAAATSTGVPGQPNQSCEEQQTGPPGFQTDGFANAQQHYANKAGTPAVSQYDVACFQLSQHDGP
jgi:hypothetical protein